MVNMGARQYAEGATSAAWGICVCNVFSSTGSLDSLAPSRRPRIRILQRHPKASSTCVSALAGPLSFPVAVVWSGLGVG